MNIRQRYKERYGKSLFHDIKVSFYTLLHIFSTGTTQTVPSPIRKIQRVNLYSVTWVSFSVPQSDFSKQAVNSQLTPIVCDFVSPQQQEEDINRAGQCMLKNSLCEQCLH